MMGSRQGEARILSKSSLVTALCQVRFSKIEKMNNYAPEIQDRLRRGRFRVNHSQELSKLSIGPGAQTEWKGYTRWKFYDMDERWAVFLHDDFVTLQTTDYGVFEDFIEELLHVLEVTSEVVGDLVVERLGLRYVNTLQGNDWASYLQRTISGVTASTFEEGKTLQNHQTVAKTNAGQIVIRLTQNRASKLVPPDLFPLELAVPDKFQHVRENDLLTVLDVDHFVLGRYNFDPTKAAHDAWALKHITNEVTFDHLFTPEALEKWR